MIIRDDNQYFQNEESICLQTKNYWYRTYMSFIKNSVQFFGPSPTTTSSSRIC